MTKGDYNHFYEALEEQIDPEDVYSWNQLKNLMRNLNFNKGLYPSTLQTRMAWDYYKKRTKHSIADVGHLREEIIQKRKIAKDYGYEKKIRTRTTKYDIRHHGVVLSSGDPVPDDVPGRAYTFINNRGQGVKQSMVTIKINGKWYRKGQFLPKGFKW